MRAGIAHDVKSAVCQWQRTEAGLMARCVYPPDMAVLAGHFPGQPLVPGVHALELVLSLAGRVRPLPAGPCRVVRAKFARPIAPQQSFELVLTCSPTTAEAVRLAATLREPRQGGVLAQIIMEIGNS